MGLWDLGGFLPSDLLLVLALEESSDWMRAVAWANEHGVAGGIPRSCSAWSARMSLCPLAPAARTRCTQHVAHGLEQRKE